MSLSRRPLYLLLGLLVAGALSVARPSRAQDGEAAPAHGVRDFFPGPDTLDDTIHVTVRGHAEVIASSVVLEYILRGPAETAAEAEKLYTKKIRTAIETMADTDPITSKISVEVVGFKKEQAAGFIFKLNANGRPPFTTEKGATYTCRLLVRIRDLDTVSPRLETRRLAEIMDKLSESELTGAEDDCDIIAARMEIDLDRLRDAAYADALRVARSRATDLASLSHRQLGKVTLVRENAWTCNNEQILYNTNYFNFVYPGNLQGWKAHLRVAGETDLSVVFQLQ